MKKKWLFSLLVIPLAMLTPNIYRYIYTHFVIPDVTVAGFVQMADGLGRQSVELIDTLHEHFDVHFCKTRTTYNTQDVPSHLLEILRNRKRPLGKVLIFEDTIGQPIECFEKVFHAKGNPQLKVAYSMFETSKIPPAFVNKLHQYFDAVVVADPYNVESYKNSGVTLPIFTLPLGLDLDAFMKAPLKSARNTPFVFASFGSCEGRKNYITTLQAFALAFGNREDVMLQLHARRGVSSTIQAVKDEIKRLGLTNVSFNIQSVDREHYIQNFQSIDCYVSLSKGEGFSIQPREALALGIPVILSDQTAQSTLCQSGLVRSVPATIKEKACYESLPDDDYGYFFNVSIDDAAAAFQDVFHHYDEYLARAQQGREWVKYYEYKHLKPLYLTLVKPQQLILGEKNLVTEDTLTTNDVALYNKYLTLYPHLKP